MIRLFRGLKKRLRGGRGQGMTEYVIIVSLIAIACLATVSKFGNNIRAIFAASSDAISGNQNVDPKSYGGDLKASTTSTDITSFGKGNTGP